ncbi:hypothetical protein HNR44_001562 [Geomicrobium halophilum]|uniref:Uncharacterized protein n=1 Tax=Geomicrobium halophilum TaxID=549000 RepID=A0A841PYB1_9BACL|nr:hypothetical protein [Geomicrobium halophilum]MBB6449613.1 hypothetical protein [Geomicrobium halophilum]
MSITTPTKTSATTIVTAGFQYHPPKTALGIGFYEVTALANGRVWHVMPSAWADFITDQGFVTDGAIMGYVGLPAELLAEITEGVSR